MSFGFSVFRIVPGIGFFIAGYSKLSVLVANGFSPSSYGTLNMFLNVFHGDTSTVPVAVRVFFPKIFLYPFSYALPFIEIIIGISLILGFQRKWGTTIGMLLLGMMLGGSHAAISALGVTLIIEQLLYTLVLFIIYIGTEKDFKDPIALDNILKKR